MAVSINVVLKAIVEIDRSLQPIGLLKKPNVSDVEAIAGENITAADRDEAWAKFQDPDFDPELLDAEVEGAVGSGAETIIRPEMSNPPVVKNGYQSPIEIRGVVIPVGESREVPGLDPEHKVIKRWMEQEVIWAS